MVCVLARRTPQTGRAASARSVPATVTGDTPTPARHASPSRVLANTTHAQAARADNPTRVHSSPADHTAGRARPTRPIRVLSSPTAQAGAGLNPRSVRARSARLTARAAGPGPVLASRTARTARAARPGSILANPAARAVARESERADGAVERAARVNARDPGRSPPSAAGARHTRTRTTLIVPARGTTRQTRGAVRTRAVRARVTNPTAPSRNRQAVAPCGARNAHGPIGVAAGAVYALTGPVARAVNPGSYVNMARQTVIHAGEELNVSRRTQRADRHAARRVVRSNRAGGTVA